MSLPNGSAAPDIHLPAHDGTVFRLGGPRSRPLVLLFFPLAFSDTCTAEVCAVRDDLASYEVLAAEVVAVSVDSPYALARFRDACGAGFTFASDFNREAARAFGVLRSGAVGPGLLGVTARAAFVLDRSGMVRYGWQTEAPGVLPPFAEIKEILRALS